MFRDTRALTGVRGVAALWVMCAHFFGSYEGTPAAHLVGKGYLAVDLFFVLSGFVIALNGGAAFASGSPSNLCLGFYRRRIERVYPLYLVMTLVVLATAALAGRVPYSATGIVENLTMTHMWVAHDGIVGPSWSLSAEAFAYVAFPWIAALAFRRSIGFVAAALVACWACLGLMAAFGAGGVVELAPGGPLDIHNGAYFPILRCLCGFSAGVCAYRLSCLPTVRAALSTRGLPEALVAVIVALAWATDQDVAIAVMFTLLVACLTVPEHATSRLLRSGIAMRLGAWSYAIYLGHMLIGTTVRDALAPSLPMGYVLVACAVAALVGGFVLHEFVERPLHAAIKRLREAPLAAARAVAA